ncbi:MFS transporter [Arthrobacter sp. 9V]|uniref:MFS transporter n=1 Tax=Arthrobacter sp. 9V TaxID=2653132 RepID=UPI00135B717D|nr:MFS transporter [Arthrobacter sp. 9V]
MTSTTPNFETASAPPPITQPRPRLRSLGASALGNLLEWFDWTIYAVFSPFIAKALFDPADPASALLATLGIFAVGFVFRPLGGIIFGRLADLYGRRRTMITTMLLMAAGSLIIALVPSYAMIGGFASLIVLIARLLQGLAHGGESIASYAYVSEIAPPAHRGLWSSTVFFCVAVGGLLATLSGALITSNVSPEDAGDWGWRIPFLIGALLAVVTLFLRRGMMESEIYEEQVEKRAAEAADPSKPSDRLRPAKLMAVGVKLFLYEAGTTVVYYTWTSFAAVFAITHHHMNPADAFLASVFAQLIYIASIPGAGWLSDKIGRKAVTFIFFGGFAVLTFPLMSMITDQPWTLFVAQGVALVLVSFVAGSQPAVISEQVPNRYRTRMLGFFISLSVAIFGGTAPYLNSLLYSVDAGWIFNSYVILMCLIGIGVVATWRETKGMDLRDV